MRFIYFYMTDAAVCQRRGQKILLVIFLLGSKTYIDTCTFYLPIINTWLFNWILLFQVKLSKNILLCLPVIVTKHTLALWDQISVPVLFLGSICSRSSGCWSIYLNVRFKGRFLWRDVFYHLCQCLVSWEIKQWFIGRCYNWSLSKLWCLCWTWLVFCLLEQHVLRHYFDSPSRGHGDRLQQITLILLHLLFLSCV